jgi:uncharacterized membrane protein YhaH (DUF805 family)
VAALFGCRLRAMLQSLPQSEATMDWQNLLFSFTGRINRAKYWLVVVLLLVYWMVVGTVIVLAFGMSALTGMGAPMIIALIAFLLPLWVGLAIGIKRLHDRNKSGWWLILFWIVPSMLSGGGTVMGGETAALLPNLAAMALSLWGLVEIGFLRGTSGPNNYGPDPLPPES